MLKNSTLFDNNNSERSFIVWSVIYSKESSALVINSGFSNYKTNDRRKYMNFEKWNGESIKFGGEEAAQIYGKGTITIDRKNKIEDVIYVKEIRHNLLSVSYMSNKGYKLRFHENGCELRKGSSRRVIMKGTRNNENIYHLKEAKGGKCLIAQSIKCWI